MILVHDLFSYLQFDEMAIACQDFQAMCNTLVILANNESAFTKLLVSFLSEAVTSNIKTLMLQTHAPDSCFCRGSRFSWVRVFRVWL